nr:hypothetical protein [Paraburkholderia silvatlantica]
MRFRTNVKLAFRRFRSAANTVSGNERNRQIFKRQFDLPDLAPGNITTIQMVCLLLFNK